MVESSKFFVAVTFCAIKHEIFNNIIVEMFNFVAIAARIVQITIVTTKMSKY